MVVKALQYSYFIVTIKQLARLRALTKNSKTAAIAILTAITSTIK